MSRGNISNSYEYISTYFNIIQQINPERFVLKIRQQPIQTRLSTNNERDRRSLEPPPIVQIELDNATAQETQDFLQNPYFFMCISLVHPTTRQEVNNTTQQQQHSSSSVSSLLSGQTVSSMYKLKDVNNHDGGFFVFGDVSVKLEGQFRLKFSMFEISQFGATNLKSIFSNEFQVYPSKSFPGMLESTFLSRSFSDQGVRIRIRKEHRVQMTGSRKRKLSSRDESLEYSDNKPSTSSYADQNYSRDELYFHSQQQEQQQGQRQYHTQVISPTQHQKAMLHSSFDHTSLSYQYQQQRQNRPPLPPQNQYHYSPTNTDSNSSSYGDNERRGSSNSMMSSDITLNPPRRLAYIDRRLSIPASPPHQSYDNSNSSSRVNFGSGEYSSYYNYNSYHHQQQLNSSNHFLLNIRQNNRMIPSPPPQAYLSSKSGLMACRRLSLDDSLSNNEGTSNSNMTRRQSADPHFYNANHYRRGSRRMSLQQRSPYIVGSLPAYHPQQQQLQSSVDDTRRREEEAEVIHLPPLRTILPVQQHQALTEQNRLHNPPQQQHYQYQHPHRQQQQQQQNGIGEVDAAVAMMQLASRRQQAEEAKSY